MPRRQPTGGIIEHVGRDGRTYRSLRFQVSGKRHSVPLGPVSRDEAERKLGHVLADVERGIWQPPAPVEIPVAPDMPTFGRFASAWWSRAKLQLSAKTIEDYEWRLERHLMPFFSDLPLDVVEKVATVEEYVAAKLAENERLRDAEARGEPITEDIEDRKGRTFSRKVKPLSPRAINMTVTLLGAILDSAVDRELIERNPARGKHRKVKERKPDRSYIETAAQITALLDAAAGLDAEAPDTRKHIERRAILATMIFAGLRISEVCSLRWRDVDLPGGWLRVGESKTDAGVRRVKLRGSLRDELTAVFARKGEPLPEAFVFPTREGNGQNTHNVRSRVVAGSVKRANANLAAAGLPMRLERITPHSLRRTFCSVRYALGDDPGTVADEMGHTDPGLAFRVYRQARTLRRSDEEIAALRALVDGAEVADGGRRAESEAKGASREGAAQA